MVSKAKSSLVNTYPQVAQTDGFEQAQLKQQYHNLLNVLNKIRESLNLETILKTATLETCQLLNADAVGMFRLEPNSNCQQGKFVWISTPISIASQESYTTPTPSSVATTEDTSDPNEYYHNLVLSAKTRTFYLKDLYVQEPSGSLQVIADIDNAGLSDNQIEILRQFHTRASLIAPLYCGDNLWGLLCIFQCSTSRRWQEYDIESVSQIAIHIGTAIKQSELLSQTQNQLATLSENVPGMIYQVKFHLDGFMRFLYVSSGCYDIYGLSPEKIKADANLVMELIHPEDLPFVNESIAISAQSLQPWRCEWRVVFPTGEIKWVQAVSRPEKQYDESIVWDGVLIDITSRKQAEETLRRQAQLLDQVKGSVVSTDLNGYITSWSKGAELLFGYTAQEALGQHMTFIYPEDQHEYLLQQVIAPLQLQGLYEAEVKMYRKSGEVLDAIVSLSLERNGTGAVVGMIGYSIDISDRKRAEAALRESEAKFRSIIENANDLIFIGSLEGKTLYISPNYIRTTGYTSEELLGQSFTPLIHPEDSNICTHAFSQLAAGEPSVTGVEYRFKYKDGSYGWFSTNIAAVKDTNNNILYFIGIARDITERKKAEALLQEKEQFLSSIYNGVEHLIAVVDILQDGDFKYVGWNPVAERVIEIQNTDIVGKTPEEVFGFVEGVRVRQLYTNCIKAGTAITSEQCFNFKGLESWWLIAINPLRNSEGRIYRLIITSFDITERKRTEAALRESEAKFRRIVEANVVGVYFGDTNGQIFEANDAFLEIVGYTREELQRGIVRWDCLTPPEYQPLDTQQVQELLISGVCAPFEKEYIRKDGTRVPILIGIAGIEDRKKDGHCICFIVDLTKIKQIEEALRRSEERFRCLTEATAQIIWSSSSYGMADGQQQGWAAFSGQTNDEVLGWGWLNAIHPDDQAEAARAWSDAVEQKTLFQTEHRVRRYDGEYRYMSARAIPVLNPDGSIREWIGTHTDITERKQAEILLKQQAEDLEKTLYELHRTQTQMIQSEKMSSLGQMVAGVAHEINNPVNFIHGNLTHGCQYTEDLLRLVQLYQEHYPNPVAEIREEIELIDLEFLQQDLIKLLNSMKVGTQRIREIVQSLRTFSRLDEAECKTADIHEGIDSTLMILNNQLKAKPERPAIEVFRNYGSLPLVECYPGQLNQVFMNIIVNAIDALEERDNQRSFEEIIQNPSKIYIVTEVVQCEKAVRIKIGDNGLGMPEVIKKHIFNPFFTTKAVGKGTGLGMSISYQIITEKHKGTLSCISSVGEGTEFMIQIPIEQEV